MLTHWCHPRVKSKKIRLRVAYINPFPPFMKNTPCSLNPFKPNGISHWYQLDQVHSQLLGCFYFHFYSKELRALRGYFNCKVDSYETYVVLYSTSILTHISLASFLWDIGKQRKPRSDATERGVWSRSPLLAYKMFNQKLNKTEKYHPTPLKFEIDSSYWER